MENNEAYKELNEYGTFKFTAKKTSCQKPHVKNSQNGRSLSIIRKEKSEGASYTAPKILD